MAKLHEYPGFATVSSDLFNNTPNLDIEIRRDQAQDVRRLRDAHPGAPAQRLLPELRLPDQEAAGPVPGHPRDRRTRRARSPEDLSLLYIRSDDGKNLVPLEALVTWKTSLGPQAVNHLNQFTSVTFFFNLKPGVAIGDATDFIAKTAAEIVPPTLRARAPGRGPDLPEHGPGPDDPDGPGRVRDVRDPGDPLRELRAPADRALDAADRAGRRARDALRSSASRRSLYAFVGMFMLMGIVKKNGIMIVDFARQRVEAGRGRRAGDPRREHGPLPPDPHDDAGGGHRARSRSRSASAPTAPRAGRSAWSSSAA